MAPFEDFTGHNVRHSAFKPLVPQRVFIDPKISLKEGLPLNDFDVRLFHEFTLSPGCVRPLY
jgi:hypothetical protein